MVLLRPSGLRKYTSVGRKFRRSHPKLDIYKHLAPALHNYTGSRPIVDRLSHYDLASALIGTLPDGNPSNTPADVETQWKAIIADVRSHFKGQVFWAMPYTPSSIKTPLNLLQDVDGIYLLWSAPLSTSQSATKLDFANEAGRLLDNEVAPLASLLNKPLILAIAYPSASGAASGCIANGADGCFDLSALSRPNADISSIGLDLQTQADVYEAMLTALNVRSWVSGFISRGYYILAAFQGKSP